MKVGDYVFYKSGNCIREYVSNLPTELVVVQIEEIRENPDSTASIKAKLPGYDEATWILNRNILLPKDIYIDLGTYMGVFDNGND